MNNKQQLLIRLKTITNMTIHVRKLIKKNELVLHGLETEANNIKEQLNKA